MSDGAALYTACTSNDIAAVKRILASNPSCVNWAKESGGWTPLLGAAQNGNLEIIDLLLAKGADKEKGLTSDGATPIWLAAEKGQSKAIEKLAKAGANLNARLTTVGTTPLYTAAQQGHADTIAVLLDLGADINACGKKGTTPLFSACMNGRLAAAEVLVKRGADIEKGLLADDCTPVYVAAEKGHPDLLELMIRSGAKFDKPLRSVDQSTPLYVAAQNGHPECCEILLKKGAVVDRTLATDARSTPLTIACEKGHTDVVEVLLRYNADIHKSLATSGSFPLLIATTYGHKSIVDLLIAKGAKIDMTNKRGSTSLFLAAQEGRTEIAETLIRAGCPIEKGSGDDQVTPLYISCEKGTYKTLAVLLKAGANVDAIAKSDQTSPLMMAGLKGHVECVDLLLQYRANVELADVNGVNALVHSLNTGQVETSTWLAYAGCPFPERYTNAVKDKVPSGSFNDIISKTKLPRERRQSELIKLRYALEEKKQAAEQEAQKKAQEEAAKKSEEASKAEDVKKAIREKQASEVKKAEDAKLQQSDEVKRRAEEEARRLAAVEAEKRKKEEEAARLRAAEEQKRAEELRLRVAEEKKGKDSPAVKNPATPERRPSMSSSSGRGGSISPRPNSASTRSVLCIIEYDGRKFKLDAQVGRSHQPVVDAILEKVGVSDGEWAVEVFDPELEDWFVLDSVNMLKEKERVRVIRLGAKKVQKAAPAVERSAPPVAGLNRRLCAPVEDKLGLRDYLKFPPGYKPSQDCPEVLMNNATTLGLVDVEQVVSSCKEFIEDLKFSDPPEMKLLSFNELFAIVAYTYDLGYAKPEENLYFKLNNDLRQRMKARMEAWWGYLFYLLNGLGKLPDVTSLLYRGVPVDRKDAIEKEYALNRRVRWTAFSSTTDDLTVASHNFAGPGGVVFRIKCSSGRNVKNLSYIQSEGEILLSPNITFRVTRPVHNENGTLYLDLSEEVSDAFVF